MSSMKYIHARAKTCHTAIRLSVCTSCSHSRRAPVVADTHKPRERKHTISSICIQVSFAAKLSHYKTTLSLSRTHNLIQSTPQPRSTSSAIHHLSPPTTSFRNECAIHTNFSPRRSAAPAVRPDHHVQRARRRRRAARRLSGRHVGRRHVASRHSPSLRRLLRRRLLRIPGHLLWLSLRAGAQLGRCHGRSRGRRHR